MGPSWPGSSPAGRGPTRGSSPGTGRTRCPGGTDVLVNATSVGYGDADALPPVDLDTLHGGLVVADVVVSPPRTALLRAAEAAGATTLDGLGMLVGQGALAVHLWTGVEPDRDVMRAAAAEALGLPTR